MQKLDLKQLSLHPQTGKLTLKSQIEMQEILDQQNFFLICKVEEDTHLTLCGTNG